MIADTPKPPYVAVIFTSIRTDAEAESYAQTAEHMMKLAASMEGYLGVESARESNDQSDLGITVSYWRSEDDIKRWKRQGDHVAAQKAGQAKFYKTYKTRVATITRDYGNGP